MIESKNSCIEFCCMGHETYFTEDFQSEDEDLTLPFDYICMNNLEFMPEPYEDITIEISKSHYKEEAGMQCNSENTKSLSYLGSLPAYSNNLDDKVLVPKPSNYQLSHTPRVILTKNVETQYLCKFCLQGFRTGQALGGHISR